MTRKTVTITTPDNPEPRQFHLAEGKAQAFADKIIGNGGTAVIGPLAMDDALQAVLRRAGVDPASIR